FDTQQKTVAAQLLIHGQARTSQFYVPGGNTCSFDAARSSVQIGGCMDFNNATGSSLSCDDSRTFPGREYHPSDFPVKVFYDKRGVTVPSNGYQFDRYCENRTIYDRNTYMNDPFWGPNRKVFYDLLAYEIFKPDTIAPKVTLAYPTQGAIVQGNTVFSVYA